MNPTIFLLLAAGEPSAGDDLCFGIGLIAFITLVLALLVRSVQRDTEKAEAAKRDELERLHRKALAEQEAEAARQRTAAARAEADKQLVLAATQRELAKQQQLAIPPQDAKNVAVVINRKLLNQVRYGRVLTVQVAAIAEGRLVLHWSVACDGPTVPTVTCYRNGDRIFAEHSFAGEHPDQVGRGRRYHYSFKVERDGRVIEKPDEFCFELVVPTPAQWNRPTLQLFEKPPSAEELAERRKQMISETVQWMTDEAATLAEALQRARRQLQEQGLDEETIEHMLAALEAQLRKKFGGG
jgi:hypothetical protein